MSNRLIETIVTTFRALKHRNYRLFFLGQCISVIGTWIQQVAISWLIYKLTKSAFIMGLIGFAGSLPSLFVTPFAGVFIDRMNKHKALIFVQASFLIEAFILAVATLTNVVNIWVILAISILMGISNAIDMPLRQSFIVQLVENNEDLGNAISLNSSSFNLARLIGPAIAGVLIAAVGEGWCFMINALSYVAVIWALMIMQIKCSIFNNNTKETKSVLTELKEGVLYAYHSKAIWYLLWFIGIASIFGMAFQIVMPIYAKEVLGGNAQTLGYLMSASGVGALAGALYLSSRTSVKGLGKFTCIASVLFGIGLMGLNYINTLPLAVASLTVAGFGMVGIIASCNTLIQFFVDEDKRGRVMSLYTVAFFGTVPFGSLFEGFIADKIGVQLTYFFNGAILILLAYLLITKLKYFNEK